MRPWTLVVCLLLAGCAQPGPGGEDTDAEDGLRVEGDLHECPPGYCVDARAWNDGADTYHVSSVCVPPWREEMQRDGEPVQHREPMAYCAAFGTQPFPPGAERAVEATWDGRVWNGEELEPAPPGTYVWRLTFRAYAGSDGAGPVDLVLEFPVVVGAT